MIKVTSKKREQLIKEYLNTPIQIGDSVNVLDHSYGSNGKTISCKIISVEPLVVVKYDNSLKLTITLDDIKDRNTKHIGANPFVKQHSQVHNVAFSLESLVYSLHLVDSDREYDINCVPVMECNWNPYVYDVDGNKQYYQRDFVWTLENKQNLIESIYNHIDCGKILIRKFDWDELEVKQLNGETELAFKDIVDGKQRLNAIREFLNGEFVDIHGNYYGDLSNTAQRHILDHHLFSYSEMENVNDQGVLTQFLKLNFEGIPQSTEHLDYVRSLKG